MPQDSSKNLEHSVKPDEMGIKELLDYELPDIKVTKKIRDKIVENSNKYGFGDVRRFMGLSYTLKEYNVLQRKILSISLP